MSIEGRLDKLERAASERPVNTAASPALDWWQNAALDAMGHDERQRLALAVRAAAANDYSIMSVEDCRAAVADYQRRLEDSLATVLERFPDITRRDLEAEKARRAAFS